MNPASIDPELLEEMDFSFSCNKCSFCTTDMMEIKKHMFQHKNQGKDPSQTVAAVGSGVAPQKEAVKERPTKNSSKDSLDQDQPLDKATPSRKDTSEDSPTTNDIPANLTKDTPTSPSPTQQTQSDSAGTPSPPELSDGESVEIKVEGDGVQVEEKEAVTAADGIQSGGRAVPVIVTKPAEQTADKVHAHQQQNDTTSQGNNGEGPDSIANRIHSRHRKRPMPNKPQEESEEDDADYVPYRPAKRAMPKTKRPVKRRVNSSALLNLRAKLKARPEIALDRYKCEQCHFVCKFKQNLNAHVRGAHPEVFTKKMAEARDKEEAEEDGEEENEDENEDENEEVNETIQLKTIVDVAQCHVALDRYSCTRCDNFFCRFKKDLKEHKNKVHGIASPLYKYQSRIREDRYRCLECDFVCKFQRSLRLHRRSAHPKVIKTPEKEKKEKKVPEDRYHCADCDFTCKFKGQMKSHRSKNHKKERPPKMVREQQCEYCHKFIQGTMHHYKRHLKTHTGDKPYKCTICEAVFGDQSRLNAHAPIHREERNYLCDQCGKCFKRAINLRMHRKVHLIVRPHGCELCSYRCKRHDTLNLHMKRKHLKIRRVLCDTCGKKFFSEKECQLHAARKHLPRPTPFQCTFCPAAFPFAYNLRAHMKKHPEHKPFRCDFCTFESRSKASLQDHEKMHTGEKQKKCELCDYTTSTSSNLYKHRKRQHGIVNSTRNKSPRVRPASQDGHSLLSQPIVQHESAQRSMPSTPQPMLLTVDSHHHLQMQSRLQGAPSPITSRVQGTASPAITTTSAHMDVRNIHAYEEIDSKDRRQIIYAREKSLIGSVITEALAEARNVVQSDLYSGHLIPSTMAPSGLPHSAMPVTTTMAPSHGGMLSAETIMQHSGVTNMFNSMMNLHY